MMDETELTIVNSKLGEDDRQWQLSNAEDNREAALALLSQAQHKIRILSRYLEPQLLNNDEAMQAIRRGAVRNKRFNVQIIVHEPKQLARIGHRLLVMGQNLSSYVHFRRIPPAYETMENMIIIVDDTGFLHRIHSDSWVGVANFNDATKTRRLSNVFDPIWDASLEEPELRRQSI